jgi:hypothetical protein
MMLKAKAACGDDDDSLSRTGLCSDFYVFKWVPTNCTDRGYAFNNGTKARAGWRGANAALRFEK